MVYDLKVYDLNLYDLKAYPSRGLASLPDRCLAIVRVIYVLRLGHEPLLLPLTQPKHALLT